MPSHFAQYDFTFEHGPKKLEIVLFAIISLIFNAGVFVYHAIKRPHPKFSITPQHKCSIGLHMLSGLASVSLPIVCFFIDQEVLPRIVYTLMGFETVHSLTALYQVPGLFGARFVMRPSYVFVILSKFAVCIYWALLPTDLERLTKYFVMISIYGWVRAYYYIFSQLGLFSESIYSISVLLAGLTCLPLAFGEGTNMVVLLLFSIYYLGYRCRLSRIKSRAEKGLANQDDIEALKDEFVEKGRFVTSTHPLAKSAMRWFNFLRCTDRDLDDISDKEKAMVIFDLVDNNRDGTLSYTEITEMYIAFGSTRKALKKFFRSYCQKHGISSFIGYGISYELFYTDFKSVWEICFENLYEQLRLEHQLVNPVVELQPLMSEDPSTIVNPPKMNHLISAEHASEPWDLHKNKQKKNIQILRSPSAMPESEYHMQFNFDVDAGKVDAADIRGSLVAESSATSATALIVGNSSHASISQESLKFNEPSESLIANRASVVQNLAVHPIVINEPQNRKMSKGDFKFAKLKTEDQLSMINKNLEDESDMKQSEMSKPMNSPDLPKIVYEIASCSELSDEIEPNSPTASLSKSLIMDVSRPQNLSSSIFVKPIYEFSSTEKDLQSPLTHSEMNLARYDTETQMMMVEAMEAKKTKSKKVMLSAKEEQYAQMSTEAQLRLVEEQEKQLNDLDGKSASQFLEKSSFTSKTAVWSASELADDSQSNEIHPVRATNEIHPFARLKNRAQNKIAE